MDVEISCECLVFKMKLFWRCIAISMLREKAEILGIDELQNNYQPVTKSLHSKYS